MYGLCSKHYKDLQARGKGCHPKGSGQAYEMDPCQPHAVQQGQAQGPAPGLQQPSEHRHKLGGEQLESSSEEEVRVSADISTYTSNVSLQPRKPTVSRDASREV